ncbi:MAG: hypothetical protein OEW22_14915, partial [Rubrivivax sp.]|nr:hypothetical protein [Rubrivivax sp.]
GGGHGHWSPGRGWGGVSIGIGLGGWGYGGWGYGYRPWYPGYVVAEPLPPTYYVQQQPVPVAVEPAAPAPIFYPRDGQSPAQIEADRQGCNRWATTQPSAMADASVFHRATMACMEGRGYTVR